MTRNYQSRKLFVFLAAAALFLPGCKPRLEPPGALRAEAPANLGPESSPVHPHLDDGWCGGHGVPESVCTRCDDSLIETFKAAGDWCGEHLLPESQCTRCHPEVAARWAKLNPENDVAEDEPPAENTEAALPRSQRTPARDCTNRNTKIRLADPEVARRAGFTFAPVERRPIRHTVTCPAEIAYDENRLARLAPRVAGVVREVRADLGAAIQTGDVLAIIDSPGLAEAKAELLHARAMIELYTANLKRDRELESSGIASRREVQELESRVTEARIAETRALQRLRNLGLPEDEVRRVAESGDMSPLLPLTAPFAGEIVERNIVAGETVDTARTLFALADTSRMWAWLDLADARVRLRTGMPVTLVFDGVDGDPFDGQITWVSTALDPRTRTLKARAEFENRDGLLQANRFAQAIVPWREEPDALVVPQNAVQWDGCCNVVFVRESATMFQPRPVRLGLPIDGLFEVHEGVREGEPVVVAGSYLLKTEILKGEIGAGCCPDDFKQKR